jgi:anti-sigma factor RsiW
MYFLSANTPLFVYREAVMNDDDVSGNKIGDELLIAYAANELNAQVAAKIEKYLQTHPEALKTIRLYRAIRELLQPSNTSQQSPDAPSMRATTRAQAIFKKKRATSKPKRATNFVLRLLHPGNLLIQRG